MKFAYVLLLSLAALTACAPAPENIKPVYASPMMFQGMNCTQMNNEAVRLNNQLVTLTGAQKKAANNDAALTATALILFWPAAFFIQGGDQSAEIGSVMGQADALSSAARQKGC